MSGGWLVDPFVAEVLAFERACAELRLRHDPEQLLEALSELQPPPSGLEEGEFYLAIDARSGDPVFRVLDREAAAALTAL